MRWSKRARPLPARAIAVAVVTVLGLYALRLASLGTSGGAHEMRARAPLAGAPTHGGDARRALPARHVRGRARTGPGRTRPGWQPPMPGEAARGAPRAAPVIAPFLCNGPSNQIYQAKLAVWSMREDATGATLVLPPILPHFSQRRTRDEQPVPYSTFFDVGKASGAAAASPPASPAPNLVEERDLWEGTAPSAVAAAVAATVNQTCTVYVGEGAEAAGPAFTQRLDRCKKYAQWWADRAAGRACTGGFSYRPYAGGLADLAADLARDGRQAAKGGGGSGDGPVTAPLVLACYLETFLTPAILFGARDKAGGAGGDYALEHGDRLGALPEQDADAAGAAWINAAAVLKFRGTRETDGPPRGGPPPPGPSPPSTTLALQLRVPDYVVIAQKKNRSSRPETYCLGGALECNPARHLVLPRDALFDLIAGAINGTQPFLAQALAAASPARPGPQHDGGGGGGGGAAAATASHAGGGGEPPRALSHVHLLTNDDVLGADISEFLQGRGLRVTSSPDRSLPSLMQDYKVAVDAAVFWGTRGSTISANIVHARHAAGRPARTTVLWEDVVMARG